MKTLYKLNNVQSKNLFDYVKDELKVNEDNLLNVLSTLTSGEVLSLSENIILNLTKDFCVPYLEVDLLEEEMVIRVNLDNSEITAITAKEFDEDIDNRTTYLEENEYNNLCDILEIKKGLELFNEFIYDKSYFFNELEYVISKINIIEIIKNFLEGQEAGEKIYVVLNAYEKQYLSFSKIDFNVVTLPNRKNNSYLLSTKETINEFFNKELSKFTEFAKKVLEEIQGEQQKPEDDIDSDMSVNPAPMKYTEIEFKHIIDIAEDSNLSFEQIDSLLYGNEVMIAKDKVKRTMQILEISEKDYLLDLYKNVLDEKDEEYQRIKNNKTLIELYFEKNDNIHFKVFFYQVFYTSTKKSVRSYRKLNAEDIYFIMKNRLEEILEHKDELLYKELYYKYVIKA